MLAIDALASFVCATAGVGTGTDKTALDAIKAANVLTMPLRRFVIEGFVILGCP
ncbi:hypothetical protein PQQ75_22955 [Paraburkholderia aspalathi]|uniref:hypothetical protein n=1 Tax=Paraburkholderia aspalathi TaxID=1324617 RepID=UPI0038BABB6B